MCVSHKQFVNARHMLSDNVRVVEMSSNDSWMRDCGPTFVKNDKTGVIRAVDWDFNAWGGLYDGLYFPWDKDDIIPEYRVLERGDILLGPPSRRAVFDVMTEFLCIL